MREHTTLGDMVAELLSVLLMLFAALGVLVGTVGVIALMVAWLTRKLGLWGR